MIFLIFPWNAFEIRVLYNMKHDYEILKSELKSWYPDEELSDTELNEMADRLIKFFAIGAKALINAKKHPAGNSDLPPVSDKNEV